MGIRLVIADDHAIVRQGLRTFLALDPEINVVGEARTGVEAVELAGQLKPDVILMDLVMPEMDGVAATAAIRSEWPDVEVIALTTVLEDGSVTDAVQAGAMGYVLKNAASEELRRAIHAAAAGQVYLSAEAAARLVQHVHTPKSPEALTPREAEVLRLLAEGFANEQIARTLHVDEQTINTHINSILGKLEVNSRTQAVLLAMKTGLVSSGKMTPASRD